MTDVCRTRRLMGSGMTIMFYGLYYGVLGRDFAEICAGRMAAVIGFVSVSGIPKRSPSASMCGVCSHELVRDGDATTSEKNIKLPCDHHFHEFCIRGWCGGACVTRSSTAPSLYRALSCRQWQDTL